MAKAKKKAVQKPKSKLTAEDRSAVVAYINKSRDLVSTILECGGHSLLHLLELIGGDVLIRSLLIDVALVC